MSSSNASMPHTISDTGAFWTVTPLTNVRSVDSRTSTPLTNPGPSGQKPSCPFTRSIEPESVSRKSCRPASFAGQNPARWSHTSSAHPSHGPANDRGDLAFVVQELAVRRTDKLAAMAVERRRGLHEVRGMVAFELASELHGPRGVS